MTGAARPSVLDVSVVVNGGDVSAKVSIPRWAGGDGMTIPGSGTMMEHRQRKAGIASYIPYRPEPRDYQPRDIVEQRAVAALLTSLRTQRR